MAGRGAPTDWQDRVAIGNEIGVEYGVAVNRGIVVRRHVARSDDFGGQETAKRSIERRLLGFRQRHRLAAQEINRRNSAHQLAAEGKAIVAELRHHLAPRRQYAMMKSAIAVVSSSARSGTGRSASAPSLATATMKGSSPQSSVLSRLGR